MLKDGSSWGAHAGVTRRFSRADGFTGAPAITVERMRRRYWHDLGTRCRIREQYFKAYPVCRWAQPAIEAALALQREHGFAADDIAIDRDRELPRGDRARVAMPCTFDDRTRRSTACRYPVAAALVHGSVGAPEIDAAGRDAPVDRLLSVHDARRGRRVLAPLPRRALGARADRAARRPRARVVTGAGARRSGEPASGRRPRRQKFRTLARSGARSRARRAHRGAGARRSSTTSTHATHCATISCNRFTESVTNHAATALPCELRRHRRRHPRPVDRDASRAQAGRARQDRRTRRHAHRRPRQDRHRRRRVGHRVRRGAQQLLPARDARADGALRVGVGERPRRRTATTRSATCRSARRSMHAQVGTIYEQQQAIGYESVFVEGEAESHALHAGHSLTTGRRRTSRRCCTRSAAATPTTWRRCAGSPRRRVRRRGDRRRRNGHALRLGHGAGHVDRGRDVGGRIGLRRGRRRRRARGSTRSGRCSTCRRRSRSRAATASSIDDIPMWHYMALQEGTLGVDPELPEDQRRRDAAGDPRRHRCAAALRPRRRAHHRQAVGPVLQARLPLRRRAGRRDAGRRSSVRPTRCASIPTDPKSPEFVVTDNFADMWTSALAFCQKRFEGQHGVYRKEPSGGIGCFTPDSFPVFDRFRENVYVIADSNHGYKMIGVGELVADELLGGTSALLEPFRFSRYAEGTAASGEQQPVSLELARPAPCIDACSRARPQGAQGLPHRRRSREHDGRGQAARHLAIRGLAGDSSARKSASASS